VEFPQFADLPPTLDDSQTGTPARRAGSIRRTATIDMIWPGGYGTPLVLAGRARDLLTPRAGDPRVLGEARMRVEIGAGRSVRKIEVEPARAGIEGLVGSVGGSELRGAIDRALPRERESATPLHFLLDDIAGCSLIAAFAWSRSRADVRRLMIGAGAAKQPPGEGFGWRKGRVICSGLRQGGWADTHRQHELDPKHAVVRAGDLELADDPQGWHAFPADPEVGMRRHRRVDLWREGERLFVDAFFRDACWEPDGTQIALHEYNVSAEVAVSDHTLVWAIATPRVLPFPECQWAAPNVKELHGTPVSSFRTRVQQTLTELRACTHLNDMLRSLAEVPALARSL
jgi:hypothetical protein